GMRTEDLIQQLVARLTPTRSLRPPIVRALHWFALSLAYAAAVTLSFSLVGGSVRLSLEGGYAIQQVATLIVAGLAAIAALASTIPGRDHRLIALPFSALLAWLLVAWSFPVAVDPGASGYGRWACLPLSILLGVPPAIALVSMLRRGVPLYPRMTMMVGALASVGIGNLGLQLFNTGDAAPLTILGHIAGGAAFLLVGWVVDPSILRWNRVAIGEIGR
ncbi:MAG: NrsF family protein, partial [Thermomicrobiales bacterium]